MKALVFILTAIVMICPSAEANSVGLNGTIAGLRILSGASVFYPEADVDGNKKVEMNDVILSLQIVAGLRGGFPDIVLAIANGMNSIKLAWLPAGVSYEVHLSEQDNYEPSAATLKKTVSTDQADIDGLETGRTYYALIVSADSAGNKLRSRQIIAVTTLSKPVIVSTTQKYNDAEALGLANPTITGTQYSYPKTANSVAPEVGSILMSADGLRKVTSVNVTSDSIIIETGDAELTEVLHQGKISNTLVMFDDSANPTISARDADGSTSKTMRWDDNLLVAEHKDFSEKNKRDNEQSAGVDITLGFEPEFQTDIEWEGDLFTVVKLTKCRVVGKGTFNAGINAWYKFAASGSASKEKAVFSKTFTSRYLIGSVPVYQEITLSVNAVFSASAYGKIEANADAKASTFVEMGVEYNSSTGAWNKIFDSGFEKSVTLNLSAEAGVYGEVRLIPQIQVKFYKIAAAYLTLEPFLYGEIQAQANIYADMLAGYGYGGVQLTKCDFGLKAESYVGVTLNALKKTFSVLDKTLIWESDPWLLFSLPTLTPPESATTSVNKATSLTASVANGVNNNFNDSTIRWHVYPSTGLSISGTGRTATFTPTQKGTYTIFFSGENKLGAIGRQFVKTVVMAVPYDGPPIHGVPYRYHGIPDMCLNMKRCADFPYVPDIGSCYGNFECKEACKYGGEVNHHIETGSYRGNWDSPTCNLMSYKETVSTNGWCDAEEQGKVIECYDHYDGAQCRLYHSSPNGPYGTWYRDSCKPVMPGGNIIFGTHTDNKLEGTVIMSGSPFGNNAVDLGYGADYALTVPNKYYGQYYVMLTYVHHIPDGPAGSWFIDSGQPRSYGNLVNEKKDGTWTFISYQSLSDGMEMLSYYKENYKAGVRDGGSGAWFSDGTPTGTHGNYVNDKRDGAWKWYGLYRNNINMQISKCTCEGSVGDNGYADGIWNCYDNNSSLLCQLTYSNGYVVSRSCESATEYGNFCKEPYNPDDMYNCSYKLPYLSNPW